MKRQTGATLGGLMFFMLLLSLAVYSAFRVVPAYMDYWLVGRALDKLVALPSIQNSSDENIRSEFDKQLRFDHVTLAKRSDLFIEHIPGGVRLSANFSAKSPFLGPVNLCMDFQAEASSSNSAGH